MLRGKESSIMTVVIYMENSNKNYKVGHIFTDNSSDQKAIENMERQIAEVGGILHFTIAKSEEGWNAQCDEIRGIISGGKNSNPTDYEIESNIREAILTAFHIVSKSPEVFKTEITGIALSVA